MKTAASPKTLFNIVRDIPEERDARFDRLIGRIGAAISADRTLSGRCDWVEAEAPEPVDLPVEGGVAIKAAVVPIILHYATSDALA